MADETPPSNQRRKPLQYPSTKRGRLVPTASACQILNITIDRMHHIIRAGNLPAFYYAFYYDDPTNLDIYNPMNPPKNVLTYYFYEGDLYAYAERRDAYFAARKKVKVPPYSEEQRDQVIAIADRLKAEKGYVNRTEVLDLLLKEQTRWRRSYYPIVRDVLQDKKRWPTRQDRS